MAEQSDIDSIAVSAGEHLWMAATILSTNHALSLVCSGRYFLNDALQYFSKIHNFDRQVVGEDVSAFINYLSTGSPALKEYLRQDCNRLKSLGNSGAHPKDRSANKKDAQYALHLANKIARNFGLPTLETILIQKLADEPQFDNSIGSRIREAKTRVFDCDVKSSERLEGDRYLESIKVQVEEYLNQALEGRFNQLQSIGVDAKNILDEIRSVLSEIKPTVNKAGQENENSVSGTTILASIAQELNEQLPGGFDQENNVYGLDGFNGSNITANVNKKDKRISICYFIQISDGRIFFLMSGRSSELNFITVSYSNKITRSFFYDCAALMFGAEAGQMVARIDTNLFLCHLGGYRNFSDDFELHGMQFFWVEPNQLLEFNLHDDAILGVTNCLKEIIRRHDQGESWPSRLITTEELT